MAKNLMILGTASTVGKSILTAAFCRIFKQDGYLVAPFKSQNMALNSYVTKEGLEMGRAQVVQAEAAMIEPHVNMNPILLKPTSDVGSQVIVRGKVFKNMKAKEYFSYKTALKPIILECYNELAKGMDLIILEGAGSPAEINLRQEDIVNMGMAEMVDAPVILVGDIDKGGIFASLYGTIMLLEPSEQARIKGYIINKFRGDVAILQPGIDMFYEKVKVPCLGVVPYMKLAIDDEDSVTHRLDKKSHNTPAGSSTIKVGVIRLTYMSNFTDFTVFDMEDDVELTYVECGSLLEYDLIVIPGSKNTIKDMHFLHDSGLALEILQAHRENIPIIGICGGYQLLGKSISDPFGVETNLNYVNGLGLIPGTTVMSPEKKTVRIQGIFNYLPHMLNASTECEELSRVEGYEIHMGITALEEGVKPLITLEDGRSDGAMNEEGNVIGTYLHGIFDVNALRHNLLNVLRQKKGVQQREVQDYNEFKENEYNRLADCVRNSVDMEKIVDIMMKSR
jgi:adenosylcobyric acid synthase